MTHPAVYVRWLARRWMAAIWSVADQLHAAADLPLSADYNSWPVGIANAEEWKP